MTTASFTKFVRTVEGQYQVLLGHALAKESSVDNVSRMLPLKDPIVILNKKKTGNYNPNMENKTLSLICSYVQCHQEELQCSTTVRPKGHCCDICGGIISFASSKFTVNSIAMAIQETMKENNLVDLLQYSVDRIDSDSVVPQYQVAVFPVKKYDETVFRVFIMELHFKLGSSKGNSMEYFSVAYDWSRLDHSYSRASKIAGLITFCLLLLAAAAIFLRNTVERERIRALFFANGSTPFRVVWHQGKEEEDDVVQLVNHDEDFAIEEEEDYTPSHLVLDPSPVVLEPKTAVMPTKPVSEGLPAIELNLIE